MHKNIIYSSARKLIIAFTLLTISPALFMTTAQAKAVAVPSSPTVKLSADKSSFGAADAVTLHVTISNPTSAPVSILNWLTPLNGVDEPLFEVTQDGQPVQYLGRIYKRIPPIAADYLTLAAGESLVHDVNLADYYDLSVSGTYQVKYNVASQDLYQNMSTGSLTSNILTLFIASHTINSPAEVIAEAVTGTNGFYSCSAGQQTDLINARNAASTYLDNAVAYFNSFKVGTRYTWWFGSYDGSRYLTVRNHFSALQSAVDTATPMNFDCSCTDPGTYAFVFAGSPYNIYLCGAFWSATLTGTDSKAGTLIHEVTHFTIVAGTDDYAYGKTLAHNLSISDPSLAIMNADSHEYFSENTPALADGAPLFQVFLPLTIR